MIIYIYLFMFTVFIWGVFYLLQSIVFDNPEPFDLNEIIGIIMLSIFPPVSWALWMLYGIKAIKDKFLDD